MKSQIKIVLICLMLTPIIAFSTSVAYFSDEESSIGNVFTAGEWTPDEWCLEINTNKTTLTGIGDESKLHGTRIRNRCDHNVTIDSIWVSWNGPDGSHITKINILGDRWSGSTTAGETPCEVNYNVLPGKPWQHIYFFFDSNIITGPFVFNFIMSDGSEKYVLWG